MLPQKEDDTEEKKSNEINPSKVIIKNCSICEMYNLIQQRISLYDLRPETKYNKSHIIDAINMPNPMNIHELDDSNSNIFVFYGDKPNISDNIINHLCNIAKITYNKSQDKSNKTKQKLSTLYKKIENNKNEKKLSKKSNITIPPIYIFEGEYIDFHNKYKFLCNNKQIQYPNAIIMDELYLGDGFMSEDKNIIINLGITHIINVTKCFFTLDKQIKKHIKYLQLKIEDSAADIISTYFEQTCDFINEALTRNKKNNIKNVVFVHCMAGVSRSASIIIAYLMKARKYTLCDAYIHVKKCRPRIAPNSGFFNELVQYEKKLFGVTTKDKLNNVLKTEYFGLIRYQ